MLLALDQFTQTYNTCCGDYTAFYPGVREVRELHLSARSRMAIATNKVEPISNWLVRIPGVQRFCPLVVGP